MNDTEEYYTTTQASIYVRLLKEHHRLLKANATKKRKLRALRAAKKRRAEVALDHRTRAREKRYLRAKLFLAASIGCFVGSLAYVLFLVNAA